jgi:hypothetical protein
MVNETDIRQYRTRLQFALRERQIPGDRIAEILAGLESRIARTGEHPATAFGSPDDYAATFDPAPLAKSFDLARLTIPFAIAISALILIIDGLAGDGRFGIEPLYVVLIGLGYGLLAALAWRKNTGPDPWWIATALTGLMLALGVIYGTLS